MTATGDAIRNILRDHSAPLVQAFFNPQNRFAGDTFDTLGPVEPNSFLASDVLAASLLDVPFLPRAVRRLLVTENGRYDDLLTAIPADVDLWNATDAQLAPAYVLWKAIRGLEGVGPTRASKLIARKRPRLIPVVDSLIREALRIRDGDDSWTMLREALAADDAALVEEIEHLRPADLTDEVSTLRILDAALWMNLSGSVHVEAFREN